jgi:hypothetical protein
MVLTQGKAWVNLFAKATLIAHILVWISSYIYMQKPYYVPMIKIDNMVIHVIRPHCEPLVKLALSQTWDRGIVGTHFEQVIMYEVSLENR